MILISKLALLVALSATINYCHTTAHNLNRKTLHLNDTTYVNKDYNVSFKVFSGWSILSDRDRKFYTKRTMRHGFFFGIRKENGNGFYLSDYDLNTEKCTNEQLALNLRDTLLKAYKDFDTNTMFAGAIKPIVKKKLGENYFTIVEYDYHTRNNLKFFRSVFFIRESKQNHALVGLLSMMDSVRDLEDIERGLAYN